MKEKTKKYIQIVKLKLVREKQVLYDNNVSRAEQVVEIARKIIDNSDREMLLVIGVDSRLNPTMANVVSIGGVDQAQFIPMNIFKPLILSNTTGFFLVHNHPSGNPKPSEEDKRMTDIIKEVSKHLSMNFLDHIIVTDTDEYFSILN